MTLLWVACAVFIAVAPFAVAPYAWAILDARQQRAKLIEPRRWTEAQLFEPVSKWVEDAERAVVAAERPRAVPRFEDGYLIAGPRPGFSVGGLLSPREYVARP